MRFLLVFSRHLFLLFLQQFSPSSVSSDHPSPPLSPNRPTPTHKTATHQSFPAPPTHFPTTSPSLTPNHFAPQQHTSTSFFIRSPQHFPPFFPFLLHHSPHFFLLSTAPDRSTNSSADNIVSPKIYTFTNNHLLFYPSFPYNSPTNTASVVGPLFSLHPLCPSSAPSAAFPLVRRRRRVLMQLGPLPGVGVLSLQFVTLRNLGFLFFLLDL
ncbi:unnamed protein product [Meloidogyne enterolobii]|uniref:Uncharacterized protein n=1 Tax=Meloidogyne enterolobii TaxID=390850 RepID=A0ACB0XQA9_MELEN